MERDVRFERKSGSQKTKEKAKACAALYKEGIIIPAIMLQLAIKLHSTVYTEDGGTYQLLYDFTLLVGDKYLPPSDVRVLSVDDVMTTDGVNRRLFTLSNDMQILEGMGCVMLLRPPDRIPEF